jgi:hypothetical protein
LNVALMMSGIDRIKNSVLAALPAVLMFVPAHAETRLFTDYGLELCESSGPGENCTELSGGIEVKLTGATRRDARGRTLYEATTADGATKGWITASQRKSLLSDDRVQTMSCTQNPRIGMSEEEVLASCWGKPRSRRRTGVEGLMRDQWIYGDGRYLYFDNGRLFAIE